MVSEKKCKKRITILWFSFSGIIVAITIFQSLTPHFGNQIDGIWSWLLPLIMPSISLIISVLVNDAIYKKSLDRMFENFIFNLSFIISLLYLSNILFIILYMPFKSLNPIKITETLKNSNLWLGPFQGIVIATLSVFFLNSKNNDN